MAGMSDLPII